MRHRTAILALAAACAVTIAGCEARQPTVIDQPEDRRPAEEDTQPAESPAGTGALEDIALELVPVADGFEQPVYLTGAGDGSGRRFVVERVGRVWVLDPGGSRTADEPFLDITAKTRNDSERGLLGIAFPHTFATEGDALEGQFFIHYSDRNGDTVVSRMRVSEQDPDRADPAEEILLRVPQPFSNHNGGQIAFGPDNYLYIGLGDGGSGGDPQGNGQNPATLLGSVLRIDPRSPIPPEAAYVSLPYGIPPDNPFRADGGGGGQPEVWLYGLRNPWRFSFDRETRDLWIGDVGQNDWEEIDFVSGEALFDMGDGVSGGQNFGWNVMEGSHPYPPGSDPGDTSRFTMPIIEYDHSAGNSVTGGYVYRGSRYPEFAGVYFYGDFGSGRIWAARPADGGDRNRELTDTDLQVVSFGEDDDGELYVIDFAGGVYHMRLR